MGPNTIFINMFDAEFRRIHERSCELAEIIPDGKLFWKPAAGSYSCGEYLLRSAAAIEQTFGGITATLWDDPFEWTLPEELATDEKVAEYLRDVESTRMKGFDYFTSDSDLARRIPAPRDLTSIFELLLQTVSRASQFQGRAFAVFHLISPAELSGFRTS